MFGYIGFCVLFLFLQVERLSKLRLQWKHHKYKYNIIGNTSLATLLVCVLWSHLLERVYDSFFY